MNVLKSQIKTISRLSSQAVFDCLRQTKDLRWVSPSLVVQAKTRTEAEPAYGVCISTSKRTAPHAVDRNRMRRRLKPIVVDVLPRLAKPGMDYMISCRAPVLTLTPAALEKDLCWCLKKMGLLKDAG
jgi:ribonuclease P protein component